MLVLFLIVIPVLIILFDLFLLVLIKSHACLELVTLVFGIVVLNRLVDVHILDVVVRISLELNWFLIVDRDGLA